MISIIYHATLFICILHTRKILILKTLLVLKTSETTTKFNSCSTKNTLNELMSLTVMTKFVHRQERMKTTITCSTVTSRLHKFKKFLILKILIKCEKMCILGSIKFSNSEANCCENTVVDNNKNHNDYMLSKVLVQPQKK